MKVVSLFSGAGGLDLGLHWAGHETVLFCENFEPAQQVLAEHFRGTPIAPDVTTLTEIPVDFDVLVAGFPCTNITQAGNKRALKGEQSSLVYEVFRLVNTFYPKWIIIENVKYMLSIDGGEVMNYVTGALAEAGYAWAYRTVDTRAFGLPQRRHRVLFLASREEDPAAPLLGRSEDPLVDDEWDVKHFDPDAICYGFNYNEGKRGLGWVKNGIPPVRGASSKDTLIYTPPAVWFPGLPAREAFFVPGIEDLEALQGFPRGWTSTSARNGERAHMIGNAVSVPVGEWLGRVLHGSTLGPVEAMRSKKSWPEAAFGYPDGSMFVSPATAWPEAHPVEDITGMLQGLVPLSRKAATGFLSRLKSGTVRPLREFVHAIEEYTR
jgi:DNA (cytosine-5)-methyltransferase 1